MKKVLVAGEINVDLVFGGCSGMPLPDTEILATSFHRVPGSSSMICAMGLARLGRRVAFVGRCGNDAHGTFCLQAMRKAGVDTTAVSADPTQATGVTVAISTAADRGLVTFPGSIATLQAADVSADLLAGADHLHVSSLYLQHRLRPQLPGLFARARSAGLGTSLDPGFDPEQRWGDPEEWRRLLADVDVFLPSRREILAITGCADVMAALAALDNGHTRTVVKCSDEGAVTLDTAGNTVRTPTRSPKVVRDSTGAGDSFNAGFIDAWLDELALEDCLRRGNACGSLSTRGMGGTATQPNADEVRAWLEGRG